jgi:hypothetical protein
MIGRLVLQPGLNEGGACPFLEAKPVVATREQGKSPDHEPHRSFADGREETGQGSHARVPGKNEIAHTRRIRNRVQIRDLHVQGILSP